ncbi:MAG: GntR family transcriptional regulator, partial [Coriobacteriales bacterium]|nr:GntR family transcriptional regulator [Coriobacteriales bacterium]
MRKVKWRFGTDRPIYAQIVEHIQRGILSGIYPPGSNMPSVRTLAFEAEVNPNTMQKALAELVGPGAFEHAENQRQDGHLRRKADSRFAAAGQAGVDRAVLRGYAE